MDSERWGRLDKLLHDALDRAPEERDAFLRQTCAGDDALARDARSLLSLEQQAVTFLERPAIELAARVGGGDGHADAAQDAFGQTVAGQSLPGIAAVARGVQAAAGAAAGHLPGKPSRLPQRGKEDARVVRVEAHVAGP